MAVKDKYVSLKCIECGNDYSIHYVSYRRALKNKTPNRIEAYKDKITMDTEVFHIQSEKYLTYEQFIRYVFMVVFPGLAIK